MGALRHQLRERKPKAKEAATAGEFDNHDVKKSSVGFHNKFRELKRRYKGFQRKKVIEKKDSGNEQ
ncbi:hypothetical protein SARC_08338 [Sphaeroforma arctica JP610]|uniref:Uncharacterized protein n=1 Tax=Sphaeroforma arctica JP610 TaxID=667725 RepID=A0A0L0FR68_9EUKA|nr:hypothetical protein SARC_08338 [Sphaeroforma arctica JP610]KNC79265.1 hypothetical protein SARC_08338 [Sphaeroforma arctica JP610]|eukprot:XP_014153167.1 hypothetical protein SARC_08338 [Sphaeroforma arctica JP610]